MAALSLTFEKGFRDMRDLLPVSINFGPILREKKKVLPFNLEKPDTQVRSRWGKNCDLGKCSPEKWDLGH